VKSSRTFTLRIFLVALVLRLIPVFLARGLGIGLDDMFQYDMLARSLVSGNGYRWYAQGDLAQLAPYVKFDLTSVDYDPVRGVPTSFRAPLYPAFLALVYAVSGTGFTRFFAARLAQAVLLGAPLAPLTYLTALRLLGGNERAARQAAWGVAVYPMLLLFPLGLGTENLFFLLLLSTLLVLLLSAERRSAGFFLLSGFLLGLTALTRSVILPFAGFAVLWTWLGLKDRRGAALIAIALTLTVAPWVIRNSLLYGRLTGIETSLGYNLYLGYHPQGDGSFVFGPSLDLVPILDDSVRDRIGTQRALEFIKADPGRFLPLAANRLGHFFRLDLRLLTYFYSGNFFGYIPPPLLLILGAFFGLPFALVSLSAAFGAVQLPRTPTTWLLLLLVIGYLLPHVFILSEERFHLALVPFFAVVAAQAWSGRTISENTTTASSDPMQKSRSLRPRQMAVAILMAALLIANWTYQIGSDADKFTVLLGPEGNHAGYPY